MLILLMEAVEKGLLRFLDFHFARMLVVDNSESLRLLIAACVSAASGEGHICLPLDYFKKGELFFGRYPAFSQILLKKAGELNWEKTLKDWSAIGNGSTATPLVFVNDRIYLYRFWKSENQVATFFSKSCSRLLNKLDYSRIRNVLDVFFGTKKIKNYQKIAAAVALTRKVAIISGPPGTGKTTTVAKLLAVMLRINGNKLRIQLTSPTGKASVRLTESFREAFKNLDLNQVEKECFPSVAVTLHRLLGIDSRTQKTRFHAKNLLHLDVLIVDEASMIDLFLMEKLINALPFHAKTIFLGDSNQLASVEAGTVLGDICRSAKGGYTLSRARELMEITGCLLDDMIGISKIPKIRDSICFLQKSYRFDSESKIEEFAKMINLGNIEEIERMLNLNFSSVRFCAIENELFYRKMLEEIVDEYRSYFRLIKEGESFFKIISVFKKYQILCVLHDGIFGVEYLNRRIESFLIKYDEKSNFNSISKDHWYPGRPIIITQNDYITGLFNGDIGISLISKEGFLKVFFLFHDGSIKSFDPICLPSYKTAWAITVHKSQGSEFDHSVLILPVQFLPILSRELVYTAVTRAKKRVTIYGSRSVLRYAIKTRILRYSGLMEYFK